MSSVPMIEPSHVVGLPPMGQCLRCCRAASFEGTHAAAGAGRGMKWMLGRTCSNWPGNMPELQRGHAVVVHQLVGLCRIRPARRLRLTMPLRAGSARWATAPTMARTTRPCHEGCRLDRAAEQNKRQGLIVGTITLPFRLLSSLARCCSRSRWSASACTCSGRTRAGATPSRCCSMNSGHLSDHSRAAWSCRDGHGARAGGYRVRGCSCARGCWSA